MGYELWTLPYLYRCRLYLSVVSTLYLYLYSIKRRMMIVVVVFAAAAALLLLSALRLRLRSRKKIFNDFIIDIVCMVWRSPSSSRLRPSRRPSSSLMSMVDAAGVDGGCFCLMMHG
jgi:hypothetical protein